MNILEENIETYTNDHSEYESDLLKYIRRETHLKSIYPQMLSGNHQGKLLGFLAKISNAKTILEIGSFTGYSAIAMAEMTSPETHIHTIDVNEELEEFLLNVFTKGGFSKRIHLHIGNALKIIPELNIEPDFIFIDADKYNYLNYYKLVLPMLKKGGIIVADNVLWSGKVLHENKKCSAETLAIKEFNKFVQKDNRITNILLPLRDGLMVMAKK